MSVLSALARAEAYASGQAVPVTTVRHVHLSERPLVLVPLMLAGEAAAPLAVLVGSSRDDPTLFFVPQPRNRDQRFSFLGRLAGVMLRYIEERRSATETVPATRNREAWERSLDAPQILVPNSGGIEALRLLGRSARFRSVDGPYPVEPSVPILGRYLTWLAEDRAPMPGSAICAAMTELLSGHWATGQSALEDQHLAAQLAWIRPRQTLAAVDPAEGFAGPGTHDALSGADAALLVEDPRRCPPAGPATDPDFDQRVLSPLFDRLQAAAEDPDAWQEVLEALEAALRGQLQPTWDLMWLGIDLLRELPDAAYNPIRWQVDCGRFTNFAQQTDDGAPPQARLDSAVHAAARLANLEAAQESHQLHRALDDPLVMAQYRVTGEAFRGEVIAVDQDRQITRNKRAWPRPRVLLRTSDPALVRIGAKVASPARINQKKVVVVGLEREGEDLIIELELQDGMGRGAKPEPGSVPEVGELRTYATLLSAETFTPPPFPEIEATPWTHGGPPPAYVPAQAEQSED
ncbi:MAG TPA: hypothetical protein VGX23_07910 [Actinocrinis sp.]|nr:hypothetical protein [Actinocrinis sp.]